MDNQAHSYTQLEYGKTHAAEERSTAQLVGA